MTAPESPADSLSEALASGDEGRALRALRDHLARQLEGTTSGRDAAALGGQLLDVMAALSALPVPTEGTALDELDARRKAGDRVAPRRVRAGQSVDRG